MFQHSTTAHNPQSTSLNRRGFLAGATAAGFTLMKPELVFGTQANTKAKLGVIVAGRDPVACDCFALELLKGLGEPKLAGKRPEDIGYLRAALDLQVGTRDFTVVEEEPKRAQRAPSSR